GIPAIDVNIGQPISHRIDHLLSGTFSQIAIKIFGEDLTVLRDLAAQVEQVTSRVQGVEDLYVEQQVPIPQVRIDVDRSRAAVYGLTAGDITESLETALNGKVVVPVLEEQKSFDVFLRLDEPWRDDPNFLNDLPLDLSSGGKIPLGQVARIATTT